MNQAHLRYFDSDLRVREHSKMPLMMIGVGLWKKNLSSLFQSHSY